MKKTLAVVLAVVFVLAFAAPAFAQNMVHNADYSWDGTVDMEKFVGHRCNTGAAMWQEISGEGEMKKVMNTSQVAGKLTVFDDNDFVTAADAVANLSVNSIIRLCAQPKHTVTATDYAYNAWDDEWVEVWDKTFVPNAYEGYANFDNYDWWYIDSWDDVGLRQLLLQRAGLNSTQAAVIAEATQAELEFIAAEWYGWEWYREFDYNALTEQRWAAYVEADPGFSGRLKQDFEAAYGPWDETGLTATHAGWDHQWGFRTSDDFGIRTGSGPVYVGNYFSMNEQFARTSQGEVRRYIDISSPFSGGLVHEDMTVKGWVEIEEDFTMHNIAPGAEAEIDWWDLF